MVKASAAVLRALFFYSAYEGRAEELKGLQYQSCTLPTLDFFWLCVTKSRESKVPWTKLEVLTSYIKTFCKAGATNYCCLSVTPKVSEFLFSH